MANSGQNEVIDVYHYNDNGVPMVRMTKAHYDRFIAELVLEAQQGVGNLEENDGKD